MNDSKRAENCARCSTRKIQEKYLGRVFDYQNCPFVCLENNVDNMRSGIVRARKPRFILAD